MNATAIAPAAAPTSITITFPVTDRLCSDVLCTAFEGGTGYWAVLDNIEREELPKDVDPVGWRYTSARMADTEAQEEDDEPSFDPFTADFALVRLGLQRLLSPEGASKVRSDLIDAARRAVAEDDAGDIDADVADAIIQMGAFNELMFG